MVLSRFRCYRIGCRSRRRICNAYALLSRPLAVASRPLCRAAVARKLRSYEFRFLDYGGCRCPPRSHTRCFIQKKRARIRRARTNNHIHKSSGGTLNTFQQDSGKLSVRVLSGTIQVFSVGSRHQHVSVYHTTPDVCRALSLSPSLSLSPRGWLSTPYIANTGNQSQSLKWATKKAPS